MTGHYLVIALRNFARNKVSTAIKLLALALGLVSLLTAHVIGDYFHQADRHWAKADRIYAIWQSTKVPGGEWESSAFDVLASPPLAKYLRLDIPELETVARASLFASDVEVEAGGQRSSRQMQPVDPELLHIFDLDMIAGEANLDAPDAVLLSAETAESLFGAADPIGQTLTLAGATAMRVVGVYGEIPPPTHFRTPQMMASMQTGERAHQAATARPADAPPLTPLSEQESWVFPSFNTYVALPADGSLTARQLERRLAELAQRRVPPEQAEVRFSVVPVSAIEEISFTRSRFSAGMGASITLILYLFGAVTLAVACLDFANLSVAEAAARAREIGLRKTLGARSGQVATQMLLETGLLVIAAFILVLPLTALTVTPISRAFYTPISLPGLDRIGFWLSLVALVGAVTLLAGTYPALVLARLRPAFAIRMGGLRGGATAVRTLLVGAQFAASGFLIVLVIVMLLQKADLRAGAVQAGDDPLLTLDFPNDAAPIFTEEDDLATLRTELTTHSSIRSVAAMNMSPFVRVSGATGVFTPSEDPGALRVQAQTRSITDGFFATLGVALLAGREFEPGRDTLESGAVIIDEEVAMLLGWTPQEAVGRTLYPVRTSPIAPTAGAAAQAGPPPMTVIGVVEHRPTEFVSYGPASYAYRPLFWDSRSFLTPLIRIGRDDVDSALAHIDAATSRLYPGVEVTRRFLDEDFEASFRSFNMLNTVFIVLASMAIVIAAMGLFGMASFVVQQRLREIGVRKTLGASSRRVLAMMLWDFSKPVIAANIIVWPLAWMASRAYLNLFTRRVDLTPAPFLAALAATLLIAWLAVGAQTWRAARVKPALVLKAE